MAVYDQSISLVTLHIPTLDTSYVNLPPPTRSNLHYTILTTYITLFFVRNQEPLKKMAFQWRWRRLWRFGLRLRSPDTSRTFPAITFEYLGTSVISSLPLTLPKSESIVLNTYMYVFGLRL